MLCTTRTNTIANKTNKMMNIVFIIKQILDFVGISN